MDSFCTIRSNLQLAEKEHTVVGKSPVLGITSTVRHYQFNAQILL